MQCEEVLERFKAKIPTIQAVDHTLYGMTHLDIQCSDGSVKQIVLLFERLRVDEPQQPLAKNKIYADVFVRISDQVLADIATKQISLDDAIRDRLFSVYGDNEIWTRQLDALREILPNEHFEVKQPPVVEEPEPNDEVIEFTDYGNFPQMDFSDVPPEFKFVADQLAALRTKYSMKRVTLGAPVVNKK